MARIATCKIKCLILIRSGIGGGSGRRLPFLGRLFALSSCPSRLSAAPINRSLHNKMPQIHEILDFSATGLHSLPIIIKSQIYARKSSFRIVASVSTVGLLCHHARSISTCHMDKNERTYVPTCLSTRSLSLPLQVSKRTASSDPYLTRQYWTSKNVAAAGAIIIFDILHAGNKMTQQRTKQNRLLTSSLVYHNTFLHLPINSSFAMVVVNGNNMMTR